MIKPMFEGTPETKREADKERLTERDAVLVYYGEGTDGWMDSVLSEVEQAVAWRAGRPYLRSVPVGRRTRRQTTSSTNSGSPGQRHQCPGGLLHGAARTDHQDLARGPTMSEPTVGDRTQPVSGLRPFRSDEKHPVLRPRATGRRAWSTKLADTPLPGGGRQPRAAANRCWSTAGCARPCTAASMASAGAAWRMAQLRPGSDPIGALARALAAPGVLFRQADEQA